MLFGRIYVNRRGGAQVSRLGVGNAGEGIRHMCQGVQYKDGLCQLSSKHLRPFIYHGEDSA